MITHTSVDGVPTLLAHRPGPVTAGLFFRVGRADETLATSGITHLVEHLALYRHGLSDLHYNGATAAAYTHFHVTGTPADVVEYLTGVCTALGDLPMDRLSTEKEILRTEAVGHGRGAGHHSAIWRYGAQSYGLTSYPEAGLTGLTEEDVRGWAGEWFTRENAVLWITSDTVPEGLTLDLPAGTRRPAPAATSALPRTPAYFPGEDGTVVLSAVVPRSTEASLFADVLGKELFRALRQKGGYSYTAAADYTLRDGSCATLTAFADSLPQKQDAVVGGLVDVFAALRAGRIAQSDLDAVRATRLARFDVPHTDAALLPAAALDLLMGRSAPTEKELRAEIEAVTTEDLRRIAEEVWAGALMQAPGRDVEWAGLTCAPQDSDDLVEGRRFTMYGEELVSLIVAEEGISLVSTDSRITVRYEDCALMRIYPDGGRSLVGTDGFTLAVEPTLFKITEADLAPLDTGVPAAVVVRMPARDPGQIPRTDQRVQLSSLAPHIGIWVMLSLLTTLLTLGALQGELQSHGPDGADWTLVGCFGAIAALCGIPTVRTLLNMRAFKRQEG
ncbi:insulinase family protein [Streptomyces sp. NBC_00335]|uniref:M16 family metallopeptidase n=1 Tax=unclassified Streptomyces TaxID=2593676 RepID=UPI002253B0E8|nr:MULTISPECIES: insulinase family protein [unclassified Streptomyces]MCX5405143.1 insulinase family protein [Streptomyces sp. NBC_00086]